MYGISEFSKDGLIVTKSENSVRFLDLENGVKDNYDGFSIAFQLSLSSNTEKSFDILTSNKFSKNSFFNFKIIGNEFEIKLEIYENLENSRCLIWIINGPLLFQESAWNSIVISWNISSGLFVLVNDFKYYVYQPILDFGKKEEYPDFIILGSKEITTDISEDVFFKINGFDFYDHFLGMEKAEKLCKKNFNIDYSYQGINCSIDNKYFIGKTFEEVSKIKVVFGDLNCSTFFISPVKSEYFFEITCKEICYLIINETEYISTNNQKIRYIISYI